MVWELSVVSLIVSSFQLQVNLPVRLELLPKIGVSLPLDHDVVFCLYIDMWFQYL